MNFYKILNDTQCHHGFQYNLGLNIDTVRFNPSGTCEPGGLYFADLEHIAKFTNYGNKLAFVTIPDDAQVYKDPEGDKYKADRIFINKIIDIQDFEYWSDEKFCLAAVQKNGWALEHVHTQSLELCMAAVKENGRALEFVQDQTPEICLIAVKENGRALEFVRNQTPEICMAAVRQFGHALEYVQNQSPEICMAAFRQNNLSLKYIRDLKFRKYMKMLIEVGYPNN